MTTETKLLKEVETAIRTVLNMKTAAILPTSFLIADLGAESIDILDISCELEKLTRVELNFKKIVKAANAKNGGVNDFNVQDIVDYLKAEVKAIHA